MAITLRTQREQERVEGLAPVINWRDDDYAVLDGEIVIGRIYREQIPAGAKWCWFLQTGAPPPNSGSADTLDEAKTAINAACDRNR